MIHLCPLDRYQQWLNSEATPSEREREKAQRKSMVAELEKRLDAAPHPKQFYRPMAERALQAAVDARLSDVETPVDDGLIQPDAAQQAQSGAPGDGGPPMFVQKLQNFKLMEGSDATFVAKIVATPMPTVSISILLDYS